MSGCSDRQANSGSGDAGENGWQNVTWKWTKVTDKAAGTETTVPDPSIYTILFKEDGTFEGKADCNNISGSYSQENGGFFIKVETSTRAFCGEESLDQQYLSLLGSVVAGGPASATDFALETAGGAQRMEFKQ